MSTDVTVTIDDVRAVGLCVNGTRVWFARQDMDFRAFLRDGCDETIGIEARRQRRAFFKRLARSGLGEWIAHESPRSLSNRTPQREIKSGFSRRTPVR